MCLIDRSLQPATLAADALVCDRYVVALRCAKDDAGLGSDIKQQSMIVRCCLSVGDPARRYLNSFDGKITNAVFSQAFTADTLVCDIC
jgi:hypothetical protein